MAEYRRYAVVGLVFLVVLSLGVGEAVRWSYQSQLGTLSFDVDKCESAELSVYELTENQFGDDDDPVRYGDLAPAHRDAFRRALNRTDGTVSIDPDTLPALPESNETSLENDHAVRYNDSRYRLTARGTGCYGSVGPPNWLSPFLAPFLVVNQLVREFWQPLAAVAGLVAGYLVFDRWVRFGR